MESYAERQAALNASTRDRWDVFAGHRARVTGMLLATAPAGGRLAVLGAGNANDVDLNALLAALAEVHLVDLDADALAAGAARQGVAGHPGLRLHAADVTAPPALPGPFDAAASVGLLSQLLGEVSRYAPGDLGRLVGARAAHLRTLSALGRACLLVTDVVSSDTLPGLRDAPDDAVPALVASAARGGNHFPGVNPAAVAAALRAAGAAAEFAAPWRWNLGPRVYAVCAFRWRSAALLGERPA